MAGFDTVSFLSDYGLADEFAGLVKAVIRDLAPHVTVIDLTHEIPPHDIRAGALALARCIQYVPAGVVLAVVDPGVGTARRAVAVEVAGGAGVVVGPDNGLVAPAVAMAGGAERAVVLTNPEFHLVAPGATFAGRDVFAPVAAHLCNGVGLDELGEPIDPGELVPGVIPIPRQEQAGLVGEVLWVDRFGNAQLNIGPEDVADWGESLRVSWGDTTRTARRTATFDDIGPGAIGLVLDSYGLLAIALDAGVGRGRARTRGGRRGQGRPTARRRPGRGQPDRVATPRPLACRPCVRPRPSRSPCCSWPSSSPGWSASSWPGDGARRVDRMNLASIIDEHPSDAVALISQGRATTYGPLRDRVASFRRSPGDPRCRPRRPGGDRVSQRRPLRGRPPRHRGVGRGRGPPQPHQSSARARAPAGGGDAGRRGGRSDRRGHLAVHRRIGQGRGQGTCHHRRARPGRRPQLRRVARRRAAAATSMWPTTTWPLLMFTSGTAGSSLAAMLTHGNLLANLAQIRATGGAERLSPDDVVFGVAAAQPHHGSERGPAADPRRRRPCRARGALRSGHRARLRARSQVSP